MTEIDLFYTSVPDRNDYNDLITPVGIKDNIGNMHYKGLLLEANQYGDSYSNVYLLNQKYDEFKGTIALPFEEQNTEYGVGINIYGDDKLLYASPQLIAGSYPDEFKVDVTGVVKLKIEWYGQVSGRVNIIFSGLDLYQ